MRDTYLINKVLPNPGDSLPLSVVKSRLDSLGCNRYQRIGCFGGCITNNVVSIRNGIVTRL